MVGLDNEEGDSDDNHDMFADRHFHNSFLSIFEISLKLLLDSFNQP